MKFVAVLLLMGAAGLMAEENGRLTDSERAFLVEQLEQSKKGVLASIAGLTQPCARTTGAVG
jgi:hypothetical protein